MKYLRIIYYFSILFFLIFSNNVAYAQVTPDQAIRDISQNISFLISPENPAPNTDITIKIDSYSMDLNSAKITWYINKKLIKEGFGEKSITTSSGQTNTLTTIDINIEPSDGSPSFSKTFSINPSSVDILIQGYSYTPTFYKGLPQYTKQNSELILAVPNKTDSSGILIKPQNFIYTWSRDGQVLGESSGFGKNSLIITDSVLSQPTNISVLVSDLNKNYLARNSIVLEPKDPFILFYENSPLYGNLYNKAVIGDYVMQDKEVSILGIPYFYSMIDLAKNNLVYSWSLDGKATDTPYNNYITLRQDSSGAGSAKLGLKIDNSARILQSSFQVVNVNFNNAPNL